MAGNAAGARKAAQTNKQKYGSDFYAKIGSKSWQDPNRSHETGFALMDPEIRKALGAKGGSKTKDDYKTKAQAEEEIDVPANAGRDSGSSE
jgi:hypothetical protein